MNDEGQDAPSPHAPVAWIPVKGTTPFEAFLEEIDTSAFVVLHEVCFSTTGLDSSVKSLSGWNRW